MDVKCSAAHHLHVRQVGSGKRKLLLVHGWAISGNIWKSLVDLWPAGEGELLIPDLRGTGFSAKPREGYTLDDYVADILALIDELKLEDLTLVGHSMGGLISMRIALERPHLLKQLVLVSPVPPSGLPLPDGDVAYFRSLGSTRAGMEQVLGMMMPRKPDAATFEHAMDSAASVVPEAYLGGFDAWRTANFAERVGAITTPTVVLGGEIEQPLSPALLKEQVVARIPGAKFVAVPEVGHYPYVESPAEFVRLLRENLSA